MAFLEWKSNFSFDKLSKNLDKAIKKFGGDNVKSFTKAAKDNLQKGDFKPLAEATLKARKQGVGWGGKRVGKTSSKRPLIQTGRLLNSIKEKDGEFTMIEYGFRHHAGFSANRKKIPARPFLPFGLNEQGKFAKANMKSLYDILNKVMKTKKR
jgi:phage gpG-like protein|tara:strand:- start:46 stop:504 length:459 start_codon:yes stop_codon:yes gene_type:complete